MYTSNTICLGEYHYPYKSHRQLDETFAFLSSIVCCLSQEIHPTSYFPTVLGLRGKVLVVGGLQGSLLQEDIRS